MHTVYLALGSNMGDKALYVREAMTELQKLVTTRLEQSSLWQTRPVGAGAESEDYVNAAVRLRVPENLTPLELLGETQRIEAAFGRPAKRQKNEPRALDIDLIDFAGRLVSHERLVLPHPLAHLRLFVLKPLEEIAPDLVLPRQTKTVKELVRLLPGLGVEKIR